MKPCSEQFLNAYVDGELDAAQRREVEEHVRGCAACAMELRELQELSGMVKRYRFEDVTTDEVQGIHEAIEDETSGARSVMRMGGVLALMAASILIICGVWLSVIPSQHGAGVGGVQQARAEGPEWERVAVTLRVEPMGVDGGPIELADAQMADWMLERLTRSER